MAAFDHRAVTLFLLNAAFLALLLLIAVSRPVRQLARVQGDTSRFAWFTTALTRLLPSAANEKLGVRVMACVWLMRVVLVVGMIVSTLWPSHA